MFSPLSTDRCPLGRTVGAGVPAVALLVALLWGVIYWLTPYQVDDLQFIGVYRSYNGMSDGFSLGAWWDYVREIRQGDSARIPNILAIPSMIWTPWRWLFPWLTGLMTSLMIWMAARYAFGRSLDWSSYALVWILVALFLPWRNFIVTVTYSLNYVYAAVLTMFVVWFVMGTDRWNWRFWVGLPLVMLAGWWHEGFAATALCGLGMVMLLRRGRMPLQWWILCLVYGFTVIGLVCSPLVLGRMAHEATDPGRWIKLSFAFDALMVLFFVVSLLGALCCRAGRRRLAELMKGWRFPLFGTVALTGICLAFLFTYTPRVCFWPSLAAIIASLMIWRPVWERLAPGLRATVGVVSVCLCVAHLLLVVEWQSRYRTQYDEIISLLDASPTGTLFYDPIPDDALPKATLYYPSKQMWITHFHIHTLSASRGYPLVAVVPSSLRDVRPDPALRLGGNVPLYSNGEALFVDSREVPFLRLPPKTIRYITQLPDCEVTLADGRKLRNSDGLFLYYVNSANDTLLYTRFQGIDSSEIVGIDLAPDNMRIHDYPQR